MRSVYDAHDGKEVAIKHSEAPAQIIFCSDHGPVYIIRNLRCKL